MDGFQQFLFFYLDEDTVDPETEYFVYNLEKKFSKYIEDLVDRSILYAERGY